jgi:acyl-CoA thioesterase-1
VRFILILGWLPLALGLTQFGCGGSRKDNSPTRTEEKPQKAVPVDARPVIVAFGDSLTAGFGAEPGNSYPDFLQKRLENWHVINAGVSGDTTTDGVNRLAEVLAYQPRIVVVEFGGNDGLRGLPIETTRANIEQMVSTLQKAGISIVLAGMTLPPNYGPDYIKSFERIYADLKAKYKLTEIPFLLAGVATNRNLMQRDGLHPTAKGNELVAETVLKYLKPLLH